MSAQPPIPASRAEFRARLAEHRQAAAARIARDTRAHRMAQTTLRLTGADGRPLAGAAVTVEQVRGPIRFGANSFLLGGNGSPAADARWEQLFADAFDLAVVPFFWKDVEPEPGRPRFAADSPARYRRPPIDAVLGFCARHGIEPKAHALAYHQFNPPWLPREQAACEAAYESWFARVGERYRGRIPSWDVVNEALLRYSWTSADEPMPRDWVRWGFTAARRHLPGARLILNEDTAAWMQRGYAHFAREMQPFSLLVENLLLKGVPIDEIGLQFHCFDYQERDLWRRASGAQDQERLLEPLQLLAVLDHYAGFGRPLHISEITVPCFGEDDDSLALQAEVAELLYRTWFSHPAVASIVWWNVVDGHAHGKEGELRGGLLTKDLREKPVYATLRRLIREEWRTRTAGVTDADGRLALDGFLGDYRVTVSHGGGRQTVAATLSAAAPGILPIACTGIPGVS